MVWGSRFISRFTRNGATSRQDAPAPAGSPPDWSLGIAAAHGYPATDDFLFDANGEELPGISGQGLASHVSNVLEQQQAAAQNPADHTPDMPPAALRETALHKILRELWGEDSIADFMTARLAKYLDLDSAKKTANGFQVSTHGGHVVKWGLVQTPDGAAQEAITGNKKNFTQEAADAIVALAMTHGWREINAHGNQAQKEMIWLATQRHAMAEQEEFERLKATGEYEPPVVTNFAPAQDSAVYQQFLRERAEWEARRAAQKPGENTPAVTPAQTADKPQQQTADRPQAGTANAAPAQTPQQQMPLFPDPQQMPLFPETPAEKPAETAPAAKKKSAAPADPLKSGKARNPAFEALHPRDENGHFVSKKTGGHKRIGTLQCGDVSKEFNASAQCAQNIKPQCAQNANAPRASNENTAPAPETAGRAPWRSMWFQG